MQELTITLRQMKWKIREVEEQTVQALKSC